MTRTPASPSGPHPAPHFWRAFLTLFALGLIGIAALIPTLTTLLQEVLTRAPAPTPRPPLGMLVAASLAQSALLLAVFVAVSVLLAPRLRLRSQLLERVSYRAPFTLRRELSLALTLGLGVGVLLTLLDALFSPYLGEAWQAAADETRTLGVTLTGILYGGLTEELLLRWGALTFFAWLGTRIFGRIQGHPRRAVMWGAVALTALLFGALHLPAVAGLAPLSAPLVVRTVLLNALAGLVYGWLFWRRGLEAAMLAHAATHVGMTPDLLVQPSPLSPSPLSYAPNETCGTLRSVAGVSSTSYGVLPIGPAKNTPGTV